LAIAGYESTGISSITEAQQEAIEEAMKLILEEDRDRGIGPDERFDCPGCHGNREAAGAVEYPEVRLCNSCATRFEVARVSRKVRTSAEYVTQLGRKRSA
jgi:hypothetical protein